MRRPLTILSAAALLLLVEPPPAAAQEGPPIEFFISWWKTLLVVLFIPLWTFAADRIAFDVDRIGEDVGLKAVVWNPILIFTFPVVLAIAVLMPMFLITILLVVFGFATPVGVYVGIRNSKVVAEQRVMTPAHLKVWFSNIGKKRVEAEEAKMSWEAGPQVVFDIDKDGQGRLIQARQSEFFVSMKEWISDVVDRHADRAMYDYTAEEVAIRYEIDGLWHPLEARERAVGDEIIGILKLMFGLNPTDRRSRQEARFKIKYAGQKLRGTLATQGTATGERMLITIDRGVTIKTLEELGMRQQLRELYTKHVRADKGLVLVSAMPGGGLKTSWTVTLHTADRFTRDYVTIQDESMVDYMEVENIQVKNSNKAAGQTPDTKIADILLREPDVICIPEAPNAQTVNALCELVNQRDMLTFTSIRAKDALEALLRVLMLKADAAAFAKAVTCVSNSRLIRKLCDGCKVGFEPSPQYLQQLGIPPGRVQVLYQEWQPTEEQPERPACETCGGVGYRGRTALMEVLEVNNTIRDILIKQPKLELLRQAAQQAGFRSVREEGILMVAQGITSIAELKRVLSL